MSSETRSPRTTVQRSAKRGVYDRETIHAVLDEALICHVGFAVDGQPYVLPTVHARVGERLYFHGANTNRMLHVMRGGTPVCVTATIVDGLVLARSAFHHSMNYRSVVVLGVAEEVADPGAKAEIFAALLEHVLPGRADEARPASRNETRATTVLSLAITEASAKVRAGGPIDGAEDLGLPVWAGTVPLELRPAAPVAAPDLVPGTAPSQAAARLIERGRR